MWSPTHTEVTVIRAKGLLTKGKNATNNCFVTIALGKEKYQTSVKEKAEPNVNWNEECELKIPDQGNRAELILTCLHRNNLGIDEFLGQITLPLNEMDVYDRPRAKWYRLESKPGKEKKNKERGELEVRVAFSVKSGSLTDLSKKDKQKSSIGHLASSVGGSLLSIGTIEKRKGIKKFAKSLGSKMHLHSKKKNKDGDDVSFSGSFASIGTPNSSNGTGENGSGGVIRRHGQRAGEADPGVISEDEDEFGFDTHSSGSSLNIQRKGLQLPSANFVPRNPSPLLGNNTNNSNHKVNGKIINGGKPKIEAVPVSVVNNHRNNNDDDDYPIDAEMEQIELDFSVSARTLPPPSKPPRTQQLPGEANTTTAAITSALIENEKAATAAKLDEWESKLYGGGKYLDIGSTDSLKRRSWESRVPLPTTNETEEAEESNIDRSNKDQVKSTQQTEQIDLMFNNTNKNLKTIETDSSSTTDSDSDEEKVEPMPVVAPIAVAATKTEQTAATNEQPVAALVTPPIKPRTTLLSPDDDKRNFNDFNATFSQYEKRHSAKIFDSEDDDDNHINDDVVERNVVQTKPNLMPQITPRRIDKDKQKELELMKLAADKETQIAAAAAAAEVARRRAEEDARLEAELRLNEQRLMEEEAALQIELEEQGEQKRREAKRRQEDQKLLNFAIRSTSVDGENVDEEEEEEADKDKENENEKERQRTTVFYSTPEQSPKETNVRNNHNNSEKREKRFGKFKYFNNKRDKNNDNNNDSNSNSSPKSNERIIIGHERSLTHAERRSEISAALSKKYEGKSRDELMLIANGMENEALLQRQRVKELEDYLDNLLLRVMESHPKILQNPYSRTTSAKSYKNYINMNDFLN